MISHKGESASALVMGAHGRLNKDVQYPNNDSGITCSHGDEFYGTSGLASLGYRADRPLMYAFSSFLLNS